ncbi:MAG: ribose 5-phosphate isomerase B [Magnetococcales bacterium]|nr:ribose 5-phosphate isomerase B [Magnetococcales bacterium]
MRILLASDHGGSDLKSALVAFMGERDDVELVDLGCDGTCSVDYPDFAAQLCRKLLAGEGDRGILVCGTGIGISIAANRFSNIRAALCHDEFGARMSRQHNDANVLVLGGRTTGIEVAQGILNMWLDTEFDGGRHQGRIEKIEKIAD